MGFLLKTGFAFVMLVVLAYVVFIRDIGGRSIAEHVGDVWSSELVQKKMARIRADVREDLEARLAQVKGAAGTAEGVDHLTDADRQSLEALLEKKATAHAPQ